MAKYTDTQLGYARAIVAEGRRQKVTVRGLIIALSTGLVESNMWVYANEAVPESMKIPHDKVGDDSKSVGIFQQQVVMGNGWWWGDAATCMDPASSARLFFERLVKLDYNNVNRSAGSFAQAVQKSSFPDRYDQRMADATELYRLVEGTETPGETPMAEWSGDPIWMADVLRAEGLVVDELPGNRDTGQGDFGKIWGVVMHHTGSNPPSDNPGYIQRHPTLGLASQLHLNRKGEWTVCGVGIAYHAGVGSWPGLPKNDANRLTIGVEAENNGKEGWPPVMYDSYVRGVGALLARLERQSDRAIGHKEWGAIQGKWDPGSMDMIVTRRDIQGVIDRKNLVIPGPVHNEINDSAARNPWVGKRLQPEEIPVGADQKGRLGVYENAHIYHYPNVGTFPIPHGGLFEAYKDFDFERGILGYPVREFSKLTDGAVQAFQGGVLYRKDGADRGFVVYGEIGKRWAAEGYEKGPAGWPTSNEGVDSNGNRYQVFENDILYWHSTGVVAISKVK